MMNKLDLTKRLTLSLLLAFLISICSSSSAQEDEELFLDLVVSTSTAGPKFLEGGNSPTTVEQLREMETIFARLEKMVQPATVNIQVGEAQGSGVVVSRDGYILTAAHVIERPYVKAKITFADGSTANAITLGMHELNVDSGMLKIIDKGKWEFLDIGESRDLSRGQWVMAVGHPGGLTEGRGLVYRVGRIKDISENTLKTDCALVGGDSGGPLVDMDGYVIGIHSRIGGQLEENFHVPIDKFSLEWDELANGVIVNGTLSWLGVEIDKEAKDVCRIKGINEYGPAKKAEIKAGDIILQIGDFEIDNLTTLKRTLKKFRPRDKVKVKVLRDDEEIELEVELGYGKKY